MNVSLSVKLPLSTSPVLGSYHMFLEVKGMRTAITILNAQENPIVTWKPLNPYVISKHISVFENAKIGGWKCKSRTLLLSRVYHQPSVITSKLLGLGLMVSVLYKNSNIIALPFT